MSKETTFFKEVASHNLERFHSECIAWVLNSMPKNNEILVKFNAGKDFKFVQAVAEVQQHDIVLLYENSDDKNKKYKYVFVENKTKSTLSRIKSTKQRDWKKWLNGVEYNNHKQRIIEKEGILQTAYYQLRWLKTDSKSNYKKGLFKSLFETVYKKESAKENKKKAWENTFINKHQFVKPEWVILSQMNGNTFNGLYIGEENLFSYKAENKKNSKIEKRGTLNILRVSLKDESTPEWKYLTYADLFEKPQDTNAKYDFDTQICKEYINYARSLKDENELLGEFIALKEKILKEKIDGIEVQISVGSAHGKDAIIQIYKVIEFPSEICKIDVKKFGGGSFMTIGIQIEGDTFKYSMSAEDYENTLITGNKKEEYKVACENYLKNILDDVFDIDFVKTNLGFNKPGGKSHCSFTYKKGLIESKYPESIIDFLNAIK